MCKNFFDYNHRVELNDIQLKIFIYINFPNIYNNLFELFIKNNGITYDNLFVTGYPLKFYVSNGLFEVGKYFSGCFNTNNIIFSLFNSLAIKINPNYINNYYKNNIIESLYIDTSILNYICDEIKNYYRFVYFYILDKNVNINPVNDLIIKSFLIALKHVPSQVHYNSYTLFLNKLDDSGKYFWANNCNKYFRL